MISITFLISFISFILIFHILRPSYPTGKKQSWILTGLGSFTMTLGSVPFVCDYLLSKGDLDKVRDAAAFAYALSRVFQGYLVADLTMGAIYYRSHVTLVMGWIHHAAYFVLVQFLISRHWSHVFCLAAVMELPTFLLAAASLHPSLRNDILFATTFFSTRIFFHIVLFISFLIPSIRHTVVEGSYWPAFLFALSFPMHAVWFMGCLKGFAKRAKERKEEELASKVVEVSMDTVAKEEMASLVPISVSSTPTSSIRISKKRTSTPTPQRPPLATLPNNAQPSQPQRAYSDKIKNALQRLQRQEAVRRMGDAVRRARDVGRDFVGMGSPREIVAF